MTRERKIKIPRTWPDKVKVWTIWAEGTPWSHLPDIVTEFELSEYRVKLLKREFENLTFDQLLSLEDNPVLLARHKKYKAFQGWKAAKLEKAFKANIYSQFLADHYKVLSTTALSIADLVHYVGIDNGEQTISQIVAKLSSWQSGQDPPAEQIEQSEELSDLLSSTEAKWLLSHIKYEAPELFVHFMHAHPKYLKYVSYKKPKSKNIDRWEEMTQDDVYAYGENLIDLLKLRAGRLDFKGTCEYCEGRK